MTPHIKANKGDIASIVIMPGDPLRAKKMTETFLSDYHLVSSVRGMLAYTGFYQGKRVTIMASGMGIPSMGIYAHELFSFYDVKYIIRVGSMGAYTKDLNLYDLVLATSAYSMSTFAKEYASFDKPVIEGSPFLSQKIMEVASKLKKPIKSGTIHSSSVFYSNYNPDIMYKEHHLLGVEMESFALFTVAKKFGKEAACLLTVSDNLITKDETTSVERQNHFTDMFYLALEVSKELS